MSRLFYPFTNDTIIPIININDNIINIYHYYIFLKIIFVMYTVINIQSTLHAIHIMYEVCTVDLHNCTQSLKSY